MTVAVAPEVRAARRRIVSTINASGSLPPPQRDRRNLEPIRPRRSCKVTGGPDSSGKRRQLIGVEPRQVPRGQRDDLEALTRSDSSTTADGRIVIGDVPSGRVDAALTPDQAWAELRGEDMGTTYTDGPEVSAVRTARRRDMPQYRGHNRRLTTC